MHKAKSLSQTQQPNNQGAQSQMPTANANSNRQSAKCQKHMPKANVKAKRPRRRAKEPFGWQLSKQAHGFCQYCFEYDKKTQVSLGLAGL